MVYLVHRNKGTLNWMDILKKNYLIKNSQYSASHHCIAFPLCFIQHNYYIKLIPSCFIPYNNYIAFPCDSFVIITIYNWIHSCFIPYNHCIAFPGDSFLIIIIYDWNLSYFILYNHYIAFQLWFNPHYNYNWISIMFHPIQSLYCICLVIYST